jgi:hypothetical protein
MNQLIKMFCEIDDYCKEYEQNLKKFLNKDELKRIIPKSSMALSEIMTIAVYFHQSRIRDFKAYYKIMILGVLKSYFPKAVSYTRFVELMRYSLIPLILYTMQYGFGKCNGLNFIDSTPIVSCKYQRRYSHKTMKRFANVGKSSTGWFYGMKLHLVINGDGEILSFCLTSGNVSDINEDVIERLTKNIFGKLVGDKGYISKKIFEKLFEKHITMITKVRNNMKNRLVPLEDKLLLRKRAVIESVNNILKETLQIEHTRHRSPINFLVNLVSGLVAYSFYGSKPSIFA